MESHKIPQYSECFLKLWRLLRHSLLKRGLCTCYGMSGCHRQMKELFRLMRKGAKGSQTVGKSGLLGTFCFMAHNCKPAPEGSTWSDQSSLDNFDMEGTGKSHEFIFKDRVEQ